MADFIRLLLIYYDKNYHRGMAKRDPAQLFSVERDGDIHATANKLKIIAGTLPVQSLF